MTQLRIESVSGSPINEYRIRKGKLEFRALTPSGDRYPGPASTWRTLDENDVQLHHVLGTVVSSWMKERMRHD